MARFAMEILQRTHHMKGMASTASLSDAPPQAAAALPNPIRAVIFDMDGTLLDTEAAHRDAFARTGAAMGWPMSDEMLLSMVGIHRDENLRMLAERMGPDFPVDQFYADSDALFVAALEAGARIFEGSRAIQLIRGARPVLKTAQGEVVCDTVILAGNALLRGIAPELESRMMPVGTYIIATERLGQARIESLLRENVAVSDVNLASTPGAAMLRLRVG